jgi:Concanavalin A-like lectin/glucanases superfamily
MVLRSAVLSCTEANPHDAHAVMTRFSSKTFLSTAFAIAAAIMPVRAAQPEQIMWSFERLEGIGGGATHVEGHPEIISTPAGKAVVFNGVDDALFIDEHPLAGAKTFTIEAVIRPDGGAFEQRWLHLAETDANGADTGARFLFEVRVVGDRWYLDAFINGPGYNKTLAAPEKTFPIGRWYRVAQTYDGTTYRSYVDGVLQAEAPVEFEPQGRGHASVGVRINRVNYFRGAILLARFTPRALSPHEFLPLAKGLNGGGE